MNTSEPIVVVTGNPNKLKEIMAITDTIPLTSQQIDLDEIQTLDLQAIVTHKLKQAYELIHKPVIVEDVSAELDAIDGLPGPFVKFFIQKIGPSALFDLAGIGKFGTATDKDIANNQVTIRCLAGYFDGKTMLFGEGIVRGSVTTPHGTNGFGFDSTVIPEGESRTVAEMTTEEKNQISHRAQAMRKLFVAISEHTSKDQ